MSMMDEIDKAAIKTAKAKLFAWSASKESAAERRGQLTALEVTRNDVDFAKRWSKDHDSVLEIMDNRIASLTQSKEEES